MLLAYWRGLPAKESSDGNKRLVVGAAADMLLKEGTEIGFGDAGVRAKLAELARFAKIHK